MAPHPLKTDVSEDHALQSASHALLTRAQEIVTATGQTAQSMGEIGGLLGEMSRSGVLDHLVAARPGDAAASLEVIAEHADGSTLSFYALDGWEAPPVDHVHWHNYWQSMVVVRGAWTDTVWRPVGALVEGFAPVIEIDRRDALGPGDIQFLGPTEPHGWAADERQRADGVRLLMWSAAAGGKPRMDLDLATGRVREHFGFLNPHPNASTESN